MRQAGIIAAGALYALENNRERLTVDHDNAKMLAKGLSEINGIDINPDDVETNIVNFRVKGMNIHELIEKLKKAGDSCPSQGQYHDSCGYKFNGI